MHTYKRFLLTLVALLTMTTGAWAQEEVLLTTVTATSLTTYSQSPDGIVTVTLDNIGSYAANYGWLCNDNYTGTVTVEAAQGYTITRCVFRQNPSSSPKRVLVDDLAPFTATMDGDEYYVYAATSTGDAYGDDFMNGISSIEVYGTAAAPAGTALTPDATRKVWTLDAMPAGNVELQVEYYPGMLTFVSEHGTVTVEGLSETTLPAGFEMDAEGNIYVASGTIFTLKAEPAEGYKLASWTFGGTTVPDDGTGTLNMQMSDNDAIITANFEEKTYDLTVKAANEFSEGKIESVTVAGEAAEPDADGKISGVKKGQPIILKAKEGYKFRSATVKEAAAGPKYADVVTICEKNGDNYYLISSFFDGTNANITTITKEEAIALAEYLGGGDIRVVYEEYVFFSARYVRATNAAGTDSGITLSSTNASISPLYYVPAGN